MVDWLISDGFLRSKDGVVGVVVLHGHKKPGPQAAFAANAQALSAGDRLWIYRAKPGLITAYVTVLATSQDFAHDWPNALAFVPLVGQLHELDVPISRAQLFEFECGTGGFWSGYKIFARTGRTKALPLCVGPLTTAAESFFEEHLFSDN